MPFNDDRDWSYSVGCGCRVTFGHARQFNTALVQIVPGCEVHSHPAGSVALFQSARDALEGARGDTPHIVGEAAQYVITKNAELYKRLASHDIGGEG